MKLRNAVETWTNQFDRNHNYGSKNRLRIMNDGDPGTDIWAWIFFPEVWPKGSTIRRAFLHIYQDGDEAGTRTLNVRRPTSRWSVNKINWNNQPDVTGTTVTVTKSSPKNKERWSFDVSPHVQAAANGGAWYGLRITGSELFFHSAQSTEADLRPMLEVEWSMRPEKPEDLSPSSDRAVSVSHPTLRVGYRDRNEDPISAIQIQIDPTQNWVTPAFFEMYDTSVPEVDLATAIPNGEGAPNYPGLEEGATTWWRARVQDETGMTSDWSDPVSFSRRSLGTVVLTRPMLGSAVGTDAYDQEENTDEYLLEDGSGVYLIDTAAPIGIAQFTEGSPLISWEFFGNQVHYEVLVVDAEYPDDVLWTTGKTTGTEKEVTVPFGSLFAAEGNYKPIVRVWDDVDREAVPNSPLYSEVSTEAVFVYDEAAPVVSSLGVVSDPLYPFVSLTWNSSTEPARWQIQRSEDGGLTWDYIHEESGGALFLAGSTYGWKDTGIATYKNYTWRVLPVNDGVQGRTTPVTTGSVRRLAPFLYRPNGKDAICILNPRRSQRRLDSQEMFEVLGDNDPVVVTQKLGRRAGSVEGELTSEAIPGISANTMLDRFENMRDTPGKTLRLAIANQTIDVVAYNMEWDTVTFPSGIAYAVSFDWVEVRPISASVARRRRKKNS